MNNILTPYLPNSTPSMETRSSFGVAMAERSWSGDYRYGFNGKEQDDEGTGGGLSTYDYGFRIYNPALGKFLSVDPLTKDFSHYSTYQFAGNKPIVATDLDGLEEFIVTNFYDAAGGLYKTDIQVTNGYQINGVQNTSQVVHYNRVDVDGKGPNTAVVNYLGSVSGSNIGGAGSTALPVAINNVLWFTRAAGTALIAGVVVPLQETSSFGLGPNNNVELNASTGPIALPPGALNNVTFAQYSNDGLITIDWTLNSSSSGIVPGAPGVGMAPAGVSAVAPADANIAYLAVGVNSTPVGSGRLMPLPAGTAAALGVVANPVPNDPMVANFTPVNAAPTANSSANFTSGSKPKTLAGGNGGGYNYNTTSQANGNASKGTQNLQTPANNPPGTPIYNVTSN